MADLTFFIHTHKCAGTSVINLFSQHDNVYMCDDWNSNGAMTKYFRDLKAVDNYNDFNKYYGKKQIERSFSKLETEGINFVATEWVVPEQESLPFGNKYFYFTVVRDPFARYLSNYHFDKERGYNHAPDLYSYRDKSMFRRYNYYTRLFSSRLVKDDSPVTGSDYRKATSLLNKLDAIIILEQPNTFDLLTPLGIDISNMQRKNTTSKSKKEYPPEFKDYFMKCAKWDYMLYEEAKRIAEEKLAALH